MSGRAARSVAGVLGVFAGYAVAALLLFRQVYVGDRTFFGFGDAAMQSYPWLLDVAHAARRGQLVLWDFGTQAGTSFAGELQPAPFYPVTWLLGLSGLDGIRLCNAYVLLHFTLAAASMHLLARREGLSRPAAMVGAMLFAFCGYLPYQAVAQPNIFASLCWLPLVILLTRRAFKATCWSGAVLFASLAGLAGGMQIAAGHLQPFVHSSYAVLICGLGASLGRAGAGWRRGRPVALALLGQAMAVGFAAVPIELAQQYLHLVYRWYATGMSRWPHAVPFAAYVQGAALEWADLGGLLHRSTLRALDGSLYLTVAGAVLAVCGVLGRTRLAVTLAALALFALLAGLGGHAGLLVRVFFELPLLPQLRTPVRAAYLLSFALALLAAIGTDAVLGPLRRWPRAASLAAASLVLLVLVPVARFDRPIGAADGGPLDAPAYYGSGVLQAVVALSNEGPLVDRIMGLPRDIVPANAGDVVPVLNVAGQRATMLVPLFDYLAGGWDPVGSRQLDRLGVRWVVSDHPLAGLRLRAQGTGWRIYERPRALSVLWIEGAGEGNAADRRRAPVEHVRWGANRVEFEIGALPAGTRLVFAQPLYPDWQATVDGRRVALGREEIFPAIVLPAGAHRVAFAYRPSLLAGKVLTLLCCLVLLGSGVWHRAAVGRQRHDRVPQAVAGDGERNTASRRR